MPDGRFSVKRIFSKDEAVPEIRETGSSVCRAKIRHGAVSACRLDGWRKQAVFSPAPAVAAGSMQTGMAGEVAVMVVDVLEVVLTGVKMNGRFGGERLFRRGSREVSTERGELVQGSHPPLPVSLFYIS